MPFILEAHRGVASEYTDNSLPAYRAAVEQGYGMIELDTKFTADDRCVLLHNRTINATGRNADGSLIETEKQIASMTYGELSGYTFGGERIPVLEDVLTLSLESGIRIKFDNVIQSHTPQQRKIFFDTVKKYGAEKNVGFTSNSYDFIKDEILAYIPDAEIHYDGIFGDDVFGELCRSVTPERLYIWMRYDNSRTSWNKTEPVSVLCAEKIKRHAGLGIWILTEKDELEEAIGLYGADIVETDGSLKPRDADEIFNKILHTGRK